MLDKKALVLLRSNLARNLRVFFDERCFVETMPPEITSGPGSCENIESVFTVDYFGRSAYLSQTSQLYLEAYLAEMGLEKVYAMFKSFRAEKKADLRRLTEFSLFEFEARDLTLDQLIRLLSDLLNNIFCDEQISKHLHPATRRVAEARQWSQITYSEAVRLIRKSRSDFMWGQDFSEMEESLITQEFGITFVTHYPTRFKFFNMKLSRENDDVVENCDLLLPGVGETVGGSVRETDPDIIRRRLNNSPILTRLKGVRREDFEWYLHLFANNPINRAGAGIGFERLIQFILQEKTITQCTEFPRSSICLVP